MSNRQKIEYLNKYKELLLYLVRYEIKDEKEIKQKEEQDSPKVLVLKRKWYKEEICGKINI